MSGIVIVPRRGRPNQVIEDPLAIFGVYLQDRYAGLAWTDF